MVKGLTRDRKKMYTHSIQCSRCVSAGGTLVKIGDHYEHQDQKKCRIMQLRSKK